MAEADMDGPGWRQTADSMYLVGPLNISDALILLTSRFEGLRLRVFLPETSDRDAIFSGSNPDLVALRVEWNVESVHLMSDFPLLKNELIMAASPMVGVSRALGSSYALLNQSNITLVESPQARAWFDQARFLKTPKELELLQYAGRVSAWAHSLLAESIKSTKSIKSRTSPDSLVTESFLAATFEHLCAVCGARLQAYNPIVAANAHGAVLHFPTGESIDQGLTPIQDPSLVLIDAGASYYHYTSDLTRTYFRGSMVPKEMQLLHDMVSRIQKVGMDTFKVGNTWAQVVQVTQRTMIRQLLSHHFLFGTEDELIDQGVAFLFQPHGLGHPVGLDVHDPYAPSSSNPSTLSIPEVVSIYMKSDTPCVSKPRNAQSSLFIDFDIVPGVVQTIEPGIYFIPYILDSVRMDLSPTSLSKYINWKTIDHGNYMSLGGVRIEDTLAILPSGRTLVLTKQ